MEITEMEDKAQHTRDLQLAPRDRLRAFVLLAFTIAGIYVCFRLLLPFLPALVWALALAIVFVPAHRWVEAKLSNASFAAAISVVLIGLLVVAPVLLVSSRVIESAATGASIIRDEFASAEWPQVLENNKLAAPLARWIAQADFRSLVENVTSWLTATSASFVSGSVRGLITFLVTFYLLFYFLRDRAAALNWLQEISPLSGLEMDRLFGRVADTVEATLYGTVVVAVLQGALGGLIFWWLEAPNACVLGSGDGSFGCGTRAWCLRRMGSRRNLHGTERRLDQRSDIDGVGYNCRRGFPPPLSDPCKRPAEAPHNPSLHFDRGGIAPVRSIRAASRSPDRYSNDFLP